jgi:hypothetical protein
MEWVLMWHWGESGVDEKNIPRFGIEREGGEEREKGRFNMRLSSFQ